MLSLADLRCPREKTGEREHKTRLIHPLLKEKEGGGRDDTVNTAPRTTDRGLGQRRWYPDRPQEERAEEQGRGPAVGTQETAVRQMR